MTCDTCGNAEAVRLSYSSKGQHCEKCGEIPKFRFDDVYFKRPYFDPNIACPDTSPHGNEIRSRTQKAILMSQLGMRESGDKFHGAR